MSPGIALMWAMLLPLLLLLFMVVLAEGLELSEVIWANRRKRHFLPFPSDVDRSWPKVSIHVPAYHEPPEMLKKPLDALARLDRWGERRVGKGCGSTSKSRWWP